jgi:hypothetical protein
MTSKKHSIQVDVEGKIVSELSKILQEQLDKLYIEELKSIYRTIAKERDIENFAVQVRDRDEEA